MTDKELIDELKQQINLMKQEYQDLKDKYDVLVRINGDLVKKKYENKNN